MKIKGLAKEEIELAISRTNEKFGNNIIFNRFDNAGKGFKNYVVTLKVKSSRGPGSRIGFTGRHICAACWHAHGLLFENLVLINPDVVIIIKGDKLNNKNVWENDPNIGSMVKPLYFSEACECSQNDIDY